MTGSSNTDVTDGSLRTPNHVNGEESLKNIFLDVSGNKKQNSDAGKTLIKSNSCSLNRLSLLKNKDEVSEVKKSDSGLNSNKTEVDEVDLSKKTLKKNDSFEKSEQNGNPDEDHDTEYVSFVSDGLTLLEVSSAGV